MKEDIETNELMKIGNEMYLKGLINIPQILQKIRHDQSPPDLSEIDTSHTANLFEFLRGDLFRSQKEFDFVLTEIGMLAMKYAIDHPDRFDIGKMVDQIQNRMRREGLL
jgi:hypothetical protein